MYYSNCASFLHLASSCEGIDRYHTQAGSKHTECDESMAPGIWQERIMAHSPVRVGGIATLFFLLLLNLIVCRIAHSLMFLSLGGRNRMRMNLIPPSLYEHGRKLASNHRVLVFCYLQIRCQVATNLGFPGVVIDKYWVLNTKKVLLELFCRFLPTSPALGKWTNVWPNSTFLTQLD